jgi:sulfate adenylyltransferase
MTSASTTSCTARSVPGASKPKSARCHNAPVAHPEWTPTPRELADLELLTMGALAPLRGFINPDDTSVPTPVTVTVPRDVADEAKASGGVRLTDPEGVPLAVLSFEAAYEADDDRVGLVGEIEPLAHPEYGPFRRYHRTPADVRAAHPYAFAVPLRDVMTKSDVERVNTYASKTGRTPLLLAVTGPGGPLTLSAAGLVRATLAAAAEIPSAKVVAVAVSDRGDATQTAAFAIRVGLAFADELVTVWHDGEPSPAVRAIRDQDRPPLERRGLVVFFTGLSGSGKSTLARALNDLLLERGDRTVTSLDGDVVRRHLSKGLGFSREDRETNIARIGWVAAEISRHGGIAICSPIAPFDATRKQVRSMVREAGGGFVLVHVATPLEECERRDRKGLYAKARAGEIPDFTGISSPYEEPEDADVRLDTTGRSIDDALGDVLDVLYSDGWITRERATPEPPPT